MNIPNVCQSSVALNLPGLWGRFHPYSNDRNTDVVEPRQPPPSSPKSLLKRVTLPCLGCQGDASVRLGHFEFMVINKVDTYL